MSDIPVPAELEEALRKDPTAAGLFSSSPRDQRASKCRWIMRSQVADTRRARAVQVVFELHQQATIRRRHRRRPVDIATSITHARSAKRRR